MKRMMLIAFIAIPVLISAQDSYQGIQFDTALNWAEVKKKAKNENKFIFIDCYATWCMPCKLMDQNVYPETSVGNFMNDRFVSIKLQVDSSINDTEFTKRWYADASRIQKENDIAGTPTFLFFSPSGEIMHRFTGLLDDTNFLKLANQALNPSMQYYILRDQYKSGDRKYASMKYLAERAKNSGENELARRIARDYIEGFLNQQNASSILQKDELNFIGQNISEVRSSDSVFKFIYHNADTVNKRIEFNTFTQAIVSIIIDKEEINPYLWPQGEIAPLLPDWNKLFRSISIKYNRKYAEIAVLDAKLKWYTEKNDWENVIKYNIDKVESNGLDTTIMGKYALNNLVWYVIFKHGTKKEHLNKGVQWMHQILATIPDNSTLMDTYANILYKAGKREEAIEWEIKALEIETKEAQAQNREVNPRLQQRIDLMRKNLPTWTIEDE